MTGTIKKETLNAVLARLQSGATSLIHESKELGFTHNGPLRGALKELLGVDGYNGLMQAKRPTTKSGGAVSAVERERPDDKGLLKVNSMSKAEGWGWRRVTEHEPRPVRVDLKEKGTMTVLDGGDQLLIVIDPDGREFIKALEFEKADLLRTNPFNPNDAPLRFVLYANSETRKQVEKNVEQGGELLQRGEAALQRKREKKEEGPKTLAEVAGVKTPKRPRTRKAAKEMAAAVLKDLTPKQRKGLQDIREEALHGAVKAPKRKAAKKAAKKTTKAKKSAKGKKK